VVASAAFNEQYTLSHVMSEKLTAAGFRPERRQGMGYGVQHLALGRGEVDCMVTYTGDVWTLLMKRQDTLDRETTLKEVTRFIQDDFGAHCLGPLGFENSYALAMPQSRAKTLGIRSIADLAECTRSRLGRPLKVGADVGFFQQKEWRRLKEKYRFRDEDVQAVAMDPTLMYGAASDGHVDVVVAFSSDGRIKSSALLVLGDPEHVFPPYDAILLVSHAASRRPGFLKALEPLVGSINQETIMEANRQVDVEKQSPQTVAWWLLKTGIPSSPPLNKRIGGQ
jgi:osmoprotectant transport system permease protein